MFLIAFLISSTTLSVDALPVAHHHHERALLAIHPHDRGLDIGAVANLCHVLHVNRDAVYNLERQIVQLRYGSRAAVELHLIIAIAELGVASRKNQVLQLHDAFDTSLAETPLAYIASGSRSAIMLLELAAVRIRYGRALNRRQLRPDKRVAVIEQRRFAHGRASQPNLQHRHARNVVFQNVWRKDPRRHPAQIRLRIGNHLSLRQFNARAGIKVHPNHRHAVVRLALDMLDVVDARGEAPLEIGHHPVRHLFGRKTVVLINNAENRNVDIGKDIDRHRDDRGPPQNHDQQCHDYKRVGPPQR